MRSPRSVRALPLLSLALLCIPVPRAAAQLAPVLAPGDRYVFVGADVDQELGPGCGDGPNGCGVDYGDLSGQTPPRVYVFSAVAAGALGTTRTATGRLAHFFSIVDGPPRPVEAKLIGVVKWRGWLLADIGAFDNTSSSEIGVSIYDTTDPARRVQVVNQMVHTGSIGGQAGLGAIPNYERDIGSAGFDLVVDLQHGHSYMAAVEANCTSTSGLVGLATMASYSSFGNEIPSLTDGFVQQSSMTLSLSPDLIAAVDSLRDQFEHHTHGYLTGRGVGQNNTPAVTSAPTEAATTTLADVDGAGDDDAGAPGLNLLTAANGRVVLSARVPRGAMAPVVERRTGDTDWIALGVVPAGAEVVDAGVDAGVRYGYRLRSTSSEGERVSEELWVDVPTRLALGIERVRVDAAGGGLQLAITLPASAPATLTLYDVQGRAAMRRDVSALGAGRHALVWGADPPLPSGVYLIRLDQAGRSLTRKVTVLR